MTLKQARRQARRRKPERAKKAMQLPRIPFARIAAVGMAVGIVFLTYRLSAELLDRPISSLTIEGPFERVSALQIEAALSEELVKGFLSADLDRLQDRIVALPWIDRASVARRWPGRLEISVTEQVPAACWGERGLLNTRGELFVTDARHVPAELPRLSGPEGRSAEVAAQYLKIRDQLIPRGLDVRRVHLDARGAWDLTLQNGIRIRLGRRDVDARTDLFLDVVANVITSRAADIQFVDMRYSNGFTIGWNKDSGQPDEAQDESNRKMVAGRTR
jgi:cell division protein FtsQ